MSSRKWKDSSAPPYLANPDEAAWKWGTRTTVAAAIQATAVADFGLCQTSRQPCDVNRCYSLTEASGFRIKGADRVEEQSTTPTRIPHGRHLRSQQRSQLLSSCYHPLSFIHPRLLREKSLFRHHPIRYAQGALHLKSRLFAMGAR